MSANGTISRLIAVFLVLCFQMTAFSQAPQGINYQAVIRDASGTLIANHQVGLRITLQNSTPVVYFTENKTLTTNGQGIINHIIGSGTVTFGVFSSIPWSLGDIYIKVEIDPAGGNVYSQMGEPTKFQSVPYALYAANSQQGPAGIDGVSIQWLGTFSTAPSSPTKNQAYYNSTDKKSYVYDGLSWSIITQDGSQGSAGPLVSGIDGQTLRNNGTTWEASSLLFSDKTNSRIGINTAFPSTTLDINGSLHLGGHLFDSGNSSGSAGNVLTQTSGGIAWQVPAGNITGTGTIGSMALWSGTSTLSSLPNLTFSNSLSVTGIATVNPDDPIFEVKNSAGEVLFGVYQEGVRINIKDGVIAKGAKGGFAVGGLSNQAKGNPVEYMRITPDSARIWVKEVPSVKGAKGGFAVGGLSNQAKTTVSSQLIQLTPNNYFIGYLSGSSITSGLYNSVFGYTAGKALSSGSKNTFLGNLAGVNTTTGYSNVFLGNLAGSSNISGFQNIVIGESSGLFNNGSNNILIGTEAGKASTNANSVVFIGNGAGSSDNSGFPNTFIGNKAGYQNTTGGQNAFMGNYSGYSNTTGYSNVFIGNMSAYSNIDGAQNIVIGEQAGSSNAHGNGNVFIGYNSAQTGTSGGANTFLGNYSGVQNTGSYNTFLGNGTGTLSTSGTNNVFIGYISGQNNGSGTGNIFVGSNSATNISGGNSNIFLGVYTAGMKTAGNDNLFLGNYTGLYNYTGSGNVFIGSNAGYYESGSNKLFIDNQDRGSEALSKTNSLVYGEFDTKIVRINSKLGIGTASNPVEALEVTGNAKTSGTLTAAGSFALPITTIAANTILDATHYTVLVNANSVTITLPAANTCSGRIYIIKKIIAAAGTVTIDGNASETIDGALTQPLTVQYQKMVIQSDGSTWFVIN
ncbi:MAG: hypothetical protein HOO91_13350 [Bacteroidales bacterium]|nr:hypothetical protein [Bacteroidales bacterium]